MTPGSRRTCPSSPCSPGPPPLSNKGLTESCHIEQFDCTLDDTCTILAMTHCLAVLATCSLIFSGSWLHASKFTCPTCDDCAFDLKTSRRVLDATELHDLGVVVQDILATGPNRCVCFQTRTVGGVHGVTATCRPV